MIQSKVMNKRSKVTKRQKVLLTSEMHFFSPASYDSTLAQMGVALTDTNPLAVSRESALLLHRLSIPSSEQGQPRPPVNRRWTQVESVEAGHRSGKRTQSVELNVITASAQKKRFDSKSINLIFIITD